VSTSCCKGCSRARPAHRPRPDATVRLSQRRRIDLNEELQLDLERETERPAGERPVAGRRVNPGYAPVRRRRADQGRRAGAPALDALARDTLYDLRRRTSLRCYHDLIDDVIFDNASHTATGSCTGVNNASLAGLNLSGTSHKDAGVYTDAWTFTDVTGNYNNTSEPVVDRIGHWTTEGFYQPVDMSGAQIVWNTVKVGRRCR